MSGVRLALCLLAIFVLAPSLARAQALGRKAAKGEAVGGGAGALGAAKGPVFGHPLMLVLDKDGDGVLAAKEIRSAAKSLKKLDLNRDGKLTPDELSAPPGGGAKGAGAPAGRGDGVGRVAPPGGPGAVPRGFGSAGGVGNIGGFGAGVGGAANRGGRRLPTTNQQTLGFDRNRDGMVTRQELPAQLWSIYSRFDINGDGKLDPLEMRRAQKAGR